MRGEARLLTAAHLAHALEQELCKFYNIDNLIVESQYKVLKLKITLLNHILFTASSYHTSPNACVTHIIESLCQLQSKLDIIFKKTDFQMSNTCIGSH